MIASTQGVRAFWYLYPMSTLSRGIGSLETASQQTKPTLVGRRTGRDGEREQEAFQMNNSTTWKMWSKSVEQSKHGYAKGRGFLWWCTQSVRWSPAYWQVQNDSDFLVWLQFTCTQKANSCFSIMVRRCFMQTNWKPSCRRIIKLSMPLSAVYHHLNF